MIAIARKAVVICEWVLICVFALQLLVFAVDLPSAATREKVIQTAFRRGLLLLGCGEAAIRFCPPLCVSASQVERALTILDGVLGAIEPAKVPHVPGAPDVEGKPAGA